MQDAEQKAQTQKEDCSSTNGEWGTTAVKHIVQDIAGAVPPSAVKSPEDAVIETTHLNPHSLRIIDRQDGKGRGIYASKKMFRGTLLEVSPALVLSKEEYDREGGIGESILKDYVFTWSRQTGRMAVALGLGQSIVFSIVLEIHAESTKQGSMFNHSKFPNVTYRKDTMANAIHYTLARDVEAGEELCIYYGPHAHYGKETPSDSGSDDPLQAFGQLTASMSALLDPSESSTSLSRTASPATDQNTEDLIPFADLPCRRITSEVSLVDLPLETCERASNQKPGKIGSDVSIDSVWVIDCVAQQSPQVFE